MHFFSIKLRPLPNPPQFWGGKNMELHSRNLTRKDSIFPVHFVSVLDNDGNFVDASDGAV